MAGYDERLELSEIATRISAAFRRTTDRFFVAKFLKETIEKFRSDCFDISLQDRRQSVPALNKCELTGAYETDNASVSSLLHTYMTGSANAFRLTRPDDGTPLPKSAAKIFSSAGYVATGTPDPQASLLAASCGAELVEATGFKEGVFTTNTKTYVNSEFKHMCATPDAVIWHGSSATPVEIGCIRTELKHLKKYYDILARSQRNSVVATEPTTQGVFDLPQLLEAKIKANLTQKEQERISQVEEIMIFEQKDQEEVIPDPPNRFLPINTPGFRSVFKHVLVAKRSQLRQQIACMMSMSGLLLLWDTENRIIYFEEITRDLEYHQKITRLAANSEKAVVSLGPGSELGEGNLRPEKRRDPKSKSPLKGLRFTPKLARPEILKQRQQEAVSQQRAAEVTDGSLAGDSSEEPLGKRARKNKRKEEAVFKMGSKRLKLLPPVNDKKAPPERQRRIASAGKGRVASEGAKETPQQN